MLVEFLGLLRPILCLLPAAFLALHLVAERIAGHFVDRIDRLGHLVFDERKHAGRHILDAAERDVEKPHKLRQANGNREVPLLDRAREIQFLHRRHDGVGGLLEGRRELVGCDQQGTDGGRNKTDRADDQPQPHGSHSAGDPQADKHGTKAKQSERSTGGHLCHHWKLADERRHRIHR